MIICFTRSDDVVATHALGTINTGLAMVSASERVARLAGAENWRHAAATMGMAPLWLDLKVGCRVQDSGGFWASVTEIGERMASRGLVDHAARRRAMAGLLEVPYRVLKPTYRLLRIAVTEAKCRYAPPSGYGSHLRVAISGTPLG